MVYISMAVSGEIREMCRAASSPLMMGICKSKITTSGFNSLTFSIANFFYCDCAILGFTAYHPLLIPFNPGSKSTSKTASSAAVVGTSAVSRPQPMAVDLYCWVPRWQASAAYKRIQQEIRESRASGRAVLHALQLLPRAFHVARDPGDGSRFNGSRLDTGGTLRFAA
jgi:hypothetical protein